MAKKLLNACNCLTCASFILALVFVILYGTNVGSAGYFQGRGADGVVLFSILVMVFDLLIIGRSFVKVEGIVAKCVDVAVMALKVVVPVLLMIATLNLLGTRIEGIGYIFFSNADVAKEVATPANVASGTLAIVTVVFGIVTAVISIVAAFFLPKEQPVEEQAQ